MKKFGRYVALTAALAAVTTANASLIGITSDADTAAYTIPASNDHSAMVNLAGNVGASVVATTGATLKLTFEYLFKEATLQNSFWVNGAEVFNTKTSVSGDSHSVIWNGGPGALEFSFLTGVGITIGNGAVAEGQDAIVASSGSTKEQNNGSAKQKYFTYHDAEQGYILLGLDDSGARQDADHDDMIIRIKAALVPEPGTLALLSMGLIGVVGAAGRRKLSS